MSNFVKSVLITVDKKDLDLSKIDEKHLISLDNKLIYNNRLTKNSLKNYKTVFLFLNDENLKKFLTDFIELDLNYVFLPHPDAPLAQKTFEIPKSINDAFEHYLNCDKSESASLLFVNDKMVIHNISSGIIMNLLSSPAKGLKDRFKILKFFFKRIKRQQYLGLSIKRSNEEIFETAVTDFLIVQDSKNTSIAKMILGETNVNKKSFHLFMMAPRSFFQVLSAFILKLLLGTNQKIKAFKFLGHIKDKKLVIKLDESTKILIDGTPTECEQLELELRGEIKFLPYPKYIEVEKEESDSTAFKVENLPNKNTQDEFTGKKLPWLKYATTEEYKGLFQQLRENAKPKQTYVVLMILSTILATLGLFSDSSPVIIGAMILAPLMSPIISLSMGVLRQDRSLIQTSLVTVLVGILVGYLFAVIITVITPLSDINEEIRMRTNPNIIDLGIAVISGAAGAYAHSKEEIAKTLAGVAIAVALVPPLAVSGIGLGWLNWSVFFGAFLLLITNLTGMVLAGSLTFLLAGYSPFKLAKKGLLISTFFVLALSVPLGYGFVRVVQENQIIQSISYKEFDQVTIKDVRVLNHSPLTLSITILSEDVPTQSEIDKVKSEVELILDKEVTLEIQTKFKR